MSWKSIDAVTAVFAVFSDWWALTLSVRSWLRIGLYVLRIRNWSIVITDWFEELNDRPSSAEVTVKFSDFLLYHTTIFSNMQINIIQCSLSFPVNKSMSGLSWNNGEEGETREENREELDECSCNDFFVVQISVQWRKCSLLFLESFPRPLLYLARSSAVRCICR